MSESIGVGSRTPAAMREADHPKVVVSEPGSDDKFVAFVNTNVVGVNKPAHILRPTDSRNHLLASTGTYKESRIPSVLIPISQSRALFAPGATVIELTSNSTPVKVPPAVTTNEFAKALGVKEERIGATTILETQQNRRDRLSNTINRFFHRDR